MRVRVCLVVDNLIIAESIGQLRESVEFVLRSASKQADLISATFAKAGGAAQSGYGYLMRGTIEIQSVE